MVHIFCSYIEDYVIYYIVSVGSFFSVFFLSDCVSFSIFIFLFKFTSFVHIHDPLSFEIHGKDTHIHILGAVFIHAFCCLWFITACWMGIMLSIIIFFSVQIVDVKKNIETAQGKSVYPAEQQLLIHQGKILKDDTTLQDNQVLEDSFLVIMLTKVHVLCPKSSFWLPNVFVMMGGCIIWRLVSIFPEPFANVLYLQGKKRKI